MSSEAATPVEQPAVAAAPESTPAPAAPAAPESTPAPAPAATPANSQPEEKVTLDKEAHDQLLRDAARGKTAQSNADRYKGALKKHGLLGGGHFKPQAPAETPSTEDAVVEATEEDRKAERGLTALALDPEYREVIDKDPTLRDLLVKNPLAVLPILAPDAMDADDAIQLVKEKLVERKSAAAAPSQLPEGTPNPTEPPPTPPSGGVNPSDNPVNEEVEKARKNPNTETAISGMIGAKLRAGGK